MMIKVDKRFGNMKGKTRPPGDSTALGIMLVVKQSAKRRNYNFELTFNQFKYLVSQKCFYCNKPPKPRNKYCDTNGIMHNAKQDKGYTQAAVDRSWFSANGLDRFDNAKGYTLLNSVACCEECNKMKTEMSIDQFFYKIALILSRKELILSMVNC